MDKVRDLKTTNPIIDKAGVELLEDILKAAKEGKLISFAFAGETRSSQIIRGHSMSHPKANLFNLLGGLDYEKHSIKAYIDDLKAEEYSGAEE